MTIKLKQLPDREMKRLTISVSPHVFNDLQAYAEIYADIYGKEEQPSALVPSMVEAFLASDSGFKRAQKERQQSSS
ncbi:DUF2274 domain-containing protein [Parvularcula sp. IMCC14364]|uniref:DUF2274 domain-containing protein n=1 Tax=Parvularcula sp. IMCC14364 TaxID=3067902 RepID=UPI0027419146|nr:DUF2274 domain-containing protein [Parvularcula sp. IMCC14364]